MQVLLDYIPLLLVASVFAPLTAWFAARRSRHPAVWFLFGALLGPLAVGLIAIAPPGRCPACAAPVIGWVSTCWQCGRELGGIGRPPAADAIVEVTEQPLPEPAKVRSNARRSRTPTNSSSSSIREPTAPDSPAVTSVEVVSTGIYLSGSAGLEIGGCYALARMSAPDGDRFRVFGPVDTGQITVRHEGLLEDLEVTALDDRVIISGRKNRTLPTFVFQTIGGKRGADLERALERIPVSPP